jgi:hypothetical protein
LRKGKTNRCLEVKIATKAKALEQNNNVKENKHKSRTEIQPRNLLNHTFLG